MSDPKRISAIANERARVWYPLGLSTTVLAIAIAALFLTFTIQLSPCGGVAHAAQCTIGDDETFTGDATFNAGTIDIADGDTVTQTGSRSTAVSINTYSGQIIMNNAVLAVAGEATFVVNNSVVGENDVIVIHLSGGTATGEPMVFVSDVGAGTFDITITNLHSASTHVSATEITFVVLKGSIT